MIAFVPYVPAHMDMIELQPAQRYLLERLDASYAQSVHIPGKAWTGFADGLVLGCAGFVPVWGSRATTWALFGHVPRREWPAIVSFMRTKFGQMHDEGYRRIEATVVAGFGQGIRLAHILGMEVEGRLSAYGPDGKDHFMFAKVAP